MRGGVPYIFKRYNKANNKNIPTYDPITPSRHLTYLDRNNAHCYNISN